MLRGHFSSRNFQGRPLISLGSVTDDSAVLGVKQASAMTYHKLTRRRAPKLNGKSNHRLGVIGGWSI